MTAVKDLILAASTLSSPNPVRDHLNNLNAGGSGTTLFIGGLDVNIDDEDLIVAIDNNELSVSIEEGITVSVDEDSISSTIDDELTINVEE